jgi:Clr5 domain
VLRRAVSILSPEPWQSDVRNYIEDRDHVLHVPFDLLSPIFDTLSNTSDLRTTLDETQMFNMERLALQRSVSPLSTAPDIVRAIPFSSQNTPSRLEWENHRARILQFYVNEDKTLKEIMQLMQEKHGFKATMKMYKNRLKSWNARKYMTKTERDVASRVMRARERRGEPYGRVIVRGKDRKLDVFLRHMGRSRVCVHRRKVLEDGDPSQDIIIDDLTSLQCPVFLSPLIYPSGLEKTVEVLCREMPHLVLNMPEEGLSYELFYAMKHACICADNSFPAKVRIWLDLAGEWFRANITARPALALMSLLRS